jgi:Flp pilus assembly protein CpaB
MRAKSVLLLVLALGCGLIASIGISQVMDRKSPAPQAEEKVDVFVAKVDIPKAELIKPEMVKLQQWPKEMVPDDAITKLDQIENKQAHEKILANELIREARFIKADKKVHIPPGYRVVTVKVNAEKGGHLVNVGDKVDLQVYLRAGSTPLVTESLTRTFLRDVKVFAVGTETQKQSDDQVGNSAQTVSLLVKPKEAELVTLAQRMGEVNIVMKNAADTEVANDEESGVRTKDLLVTIGVVPRDPVEKKPSIVATIADQLEKKTRLRKADSFVMHGYIGSEQVQFSFDNPKKAPTGVTQGGTRATDSSVTYDPTPADAPEEPASDVKEESKQPPQGDGPQPK